MKRYFLLAVCLILAPALGCSTGKTTVYTYSSTEEFDGPLEFGKGDRVAIKLKEPRGIYIPSEEDPDAILRIEAKTFFVEVGDIAKRSLSGRLIYAYEPDGTAHLYESISDQPVYVDFAEIERLTFYSRTAGTRSDSTLSKVGRGLGNAALQFLALGLMFTFLGLFF